MEHKISGPGPLLDADGRLSEPGWSDSLALAYDRGAIRAPAWRIKEWDYYCVLARGFGIALTVSDNGYMGFVSATVFDFDARVETSGTVMPLFPMGRYRMPPSSAEGLVEVDQKGARMRFEARSGERKLAFSWPAFGAAGLGLEGEIRLTESDVLFASWRSVRFRCLRSARTFSPSMRLTRSSGSITRPFSRIARASTSRSWSASKGLGR